jgi:transcriptional regulator with GAF, ATPase, and Fis domain
MRARSPRRHPPPRLVFHRQVPGEAREDHRARAGAHHGDADGLRLARQHSGACQRHWRAVILSPGSTLALEEVLRPTAQPPISLPLASDTLEAIERAHMLAVLEACRWQIKGQGRAADRLGLNPSTLRLRMKKLGIVRPGV